MSRIVENSVGTLASAVPASSLAISMSRNAWGGTLAAFGVFKVGKPCLQHLTSTNPRSSYVVTSSI